MYNALKSISIRFLRECSKMPRNIKITADMVVFEAEFNDNPYSAQNNIPHIDMSGIVPADLISHFA